MSRDQLAEAGGLSVGPIKRIENEGHIPKPQTLQQIAEGLATYAPGRRDDDLAQQNYEKLMQAARFHKMTLEDGTPILKVRFGPPSPTLEDQLAQAAEDREIATEVARLIREWSDYDQADQLVIKAAMAAASEHRRQRRESLTAHKE